MMQLTRSSVDERVVVEAWERQLGCAAGLAALDLSVVFRGAPSDAGGPDYQDALLARRDGTLVRGDVEFHVSTVDWYRHGHHLDSRYNSVVLHVTWSGRDAVVRQDGRAVPTLAIGADIMAPLVSPGTLAPHACIDALSELSSESIRAQLTAMGYRRLRERTDRLEAEIQAEGADQAAYAGLLEALGYSSNREPFRMLAETVRYAWIMTVPADEREAVMLSAAGFASHRERLTMAPPTRLVPDVWRLARLRPANDPRLRIAGAASLLQRLGPFLAEYLRQAVLLARRPSDLREILEDRDGCRIPIGRGRADQMVVSVMLPLAAAMGAGHEATAMHRAYPAPPGTRWTRRMQLLLAEAGHSIRPRTAAEHQGLHHLYLEHCRKEGAPACPLCGSARPTILGQGDPCHTSRGRP